MCRFPLEGHQLDAQCGFSGLWSIEKQPTLNSLNAGKIPEMNDALEVTSELPLDIQLTNFQ
jgi:hypothetical protein